MLSDVISSIFTPGTNSGLIQAMSYSFYALFVTLFGMVLLTKGNLHVVALLVLSIGLFASIKWLAPSSSSRLSLLISADDLSRVDLLGS